MKPKKLLFICGGTNVFGAEKVSLRIIEELHKRNWQVHCMLSGWNDGVFIKELQRIGVPYTTFKLGWIYLRKWKWTMDSLLHYPAAIGQFKKVIKTWKPDITICTSFKSGLLLFPFIKGKIIYHVHDKLSDTKTARKAIGILDKKISKYIAVSDFIANDLLSCGIASSKVQTVHNFVSKSSESPDLHKQPGDILQIGIVGQVSPHKGHHILIEALGKLQETQPKFQLQIIGNGNEAYIRSLKKLIADNKLEEKTTWRGYLSNETEIYKGLDLVIVPTISEEPFGLVAIEPAKFEIPVIATRVGGLPEIVLDGETGFLFENGNANQLAEKIERFLKDKQLLQMMGIKARKRLMECFVSNVKIEQFEQVIQGQDNT
jgi:glycosyltransferase involved in cell wall biosynthesis